SRTSSPSATRRARASRTARSCTSGIELRERLRSRASGSRIPQPFFPSRIPSPPTSGSHYTLAMRTPRRWLADWFLRELTRPRRHYRRFVYNDPRKLKARIEPGDVLLVDGDQRVSEAVKYLTQSSWSHSALFIGDALLRRDEATRRETLRRFGREARFLVAEAL